MLNVVLIPVGVTVTIDNFHKNSHVLTSAISCRCTDIYSLFAFRREPFNSTSFLTDFKLTYTNGTQDFIRKIQNWRIFNTYYYQMECNLVNKDKNNAYYL